MPPIPAVQLDPAWLRSRLHPLDAPPGSPGWNLGELAGLLPGHRAREAAVLVGLVPRDREWNVLLTRRTEALRRHAGQVSFPGGRVEPGDPDPASAALREACEEIGLQRPEVDPLGYLDPLATITGFRVMPLVGILTPGFMPVPDPSEVAEVFEVPLSFLMAPGNLAEVELHYRGRPRRVLEFVDRGMPGQRIWGATASILLNLRQRIGSA